MKSQDTSMRAQITGWILDTMAQFAKDHDRPNLWKTPVVRFADADDPAFVRLREIVTPDHYLPKDYLPDASTVISYFIPFQKEIPESNRAGDLASYAWADSYLTTNAMFAVINDRLVKEFRSMGYDAAPPKDAGMISMENPRSRWSQRHVAYIAGHGTFGINNMLISDSGTCGRYASVITSLPIPGDGVPTEERCLYKKNGTCALCVQRCMTGALKKDGFDRMKCLAQCMKNDAKYPGADVCGKCIVGLPCSYGIPGNVDKST